MKNIFHYRILLLLVTVINYGCMDYEVNVRYVVLIFMLFTAYKIIDSLLSPKGHTTCNKLFVTSLGTNMVSSVCQRAKYCNGL